MKGGDFDFGIVKQSSFENAEQDVFDQAQNYRVVQKEQQSKWSMSTDDKSKNS